MLPKRHNPSTSGKSTRFKCLMDSEYEPPQLTSQKRTYARNNFRLARNPPRIEAIAEGAYLICFKDLRSRRQFPYRMERLRKAVASAVRCRRRTGLQTCRWGPSISQCRETVSCWCRKYRAAFVTERGSGDFWPSGHVHKSVLKPFFRLNPQRPSHILLGYCNLFPWGENWNFEEHTG